MVLYRKRSCLKKIGNNPFVLNKWLFLEAIIHCENEMKKLQIIFYYNYFVMKRMFSGCVQEEEYTHICIYKYKS